MKTIFPDEAGLEGFFSVGFRKNPSATSNTQRVGTVVVKRSYTISGTQLIADANGEEVRFEEEYDEHNIDGEDVRIITRENDIAPYKHEADLIVLGFYETDDGGEARVNGSLWLQRAQSSQIADDPDTNDNLFGWEQRIFAARLGDTGGFSADASHYPPEWPVPAGQPMKDPLHPSGFNNRFYNAYRRSWKTFAGRLPYFSSSSQIEITRSWDSDSETKQFTLPDDELSGRYFFYCGHGPDRDSRWCDEEITLERDTLVVEPNDNRAYVLWRGVWDFDVLAEDQYRRLEVELGV